jgi:hypothetical protein
MYKAFCSQHYQKQAWFNRLGAGKLAEQLEI